MTKTLTMLALLSVFPTGVAWAEEDCFVPMANWQPREAVAQLAADEGWTVRRIKIDDGCYEIDGSDATGRAIEVKVHPATLQIIGLEYEYEDDEVETGHEREGQEDE